MIVLLPVVLHAGRNCAVRVRRSVAVGRDV